MPREFGEPSPGETGIQSEVENILDELFDKSESKHFFGDWWKDQPNAERIKDFVRRRIADNSQGEEPTSKTPGGEFERRERQYIGELTKSIFQIVEREVGQVIEHGDKNKPVTEELYDGEILPRILRELQREDISVTETSDANIILGKMKNLFIGLSYNDLIAGDEVYGIVYRRTHK